MRTTDELIAISQRLIELTGKRGVKSAQVSATARRKQQISLDKNDYQIGVSSDNSRIQLVVHNDCRLGSAVTNDLSARGLEDAVEAAIALSATSPRDEKLAFSRPGKVAEIHLKDDAITAIDPAALAKLAQNIFDPILADREIRVDGGALDANQVALCIVNTNGVCVHEEAAFLTANMNGFGVRGDQITSFDGDWIGTRKLDDYLDKAHAMLSELTAAIKSTFNPRKGESYKGMILIRPEAVSRMLLSVVGFHSHGDALKDNASKWADKLGQAVASPLFTLRDDPHNAEYIQAGSFDSEGTPTKPATLIDRGVLQFFMESVDSASRRGAEPTGNEDGLTVSRIAGGEGGVADLAHQAGRPVLAMRRFSGNLNTITGDFSGVAKNSHLLNNGESMPLMETMIAGNVFDLLNNIVAIGKSANYRGIMETGPILVDGVSVSVGG
jgi:PmbA protein